MEITTAQPSFYFTLFYVLAFVFLGLAVLIIGKRQGYSVEKLLLLLGAVSLGTVLGSRLVTIPVLEWGGLLFTDEVPFLDRAASGGIIAGLLCLILANRVLKFPPKFLVHFAWIIPIALSIQKMGCFINGCCYGTPTTVAWGAVYPKYSQPHHNHWLREQIEASSPWSLGIHPVQLYEIVSMILIALLVWKTRKFWKKSWSVIIFGVLLIFIARFATDFFRDGLGSQFGTEEWLSLRYIQWAFLFISISLGLILYLNEKGRSLSAKRGFSLFKGKFRELELAILLSLITFSFRGVFSSFEWFALWITLIPAIVLFAWRQISESTLNAKRWWAISAFFIPLWLIAQTVETIAYNDTITDKKESFHRIDVGANFGSYYNELRTNPVTTSSTVPWIGCTSSSTSYTKTLTESEYKTYGAGYSKVQRNGIKETTWGVNAYLGNINSSLIDTTGSYSKEMWGVNPYIKYEGKWYGIGVGVHAGRLYRNKAEDPTVDDFDKFVEDKPITPEFYLRLGVRKYLDVDYNYGFLFPSPFPTTYSRVSIGTGLWQDHDYSLRYGAFGPGGQFISAEGLITKNLGVNFMYVLKDDYSFEIPRNNSGSFIMSLNYRFGHQ